MINFLSQYVDLVTAFFGKLPTWGLFLFVVMVLWATIYLMVSIAPPNPDLTRF